LVFKNTFLLLSLNQNLFFTGNSEFFKKKMFFWIWYYLVFMGFMYWLIACDLGFGICSGFSAASNTDLVIWGVSLGICWFLILFGFRYLLIYLYKLL